jgi:hypothetical protein
MYLRTYNKCVLSEDYMRLRASVCYEIIKISIPHNDVDVNTQRQGKRTKEKREASGSKMEIRAIILNEASLLIKNRLAGIR